MRAGLGGDVRLREAREGFETVFMRKNGERFPVMIYEAPLLDAELKLARGNKDAAITAISSARPTMATTSTSALTRPGCRIDTSHEKTQRPSPALD